MNVKPNQFACQEWAVSRGRSVYVWADYGGCQSCGTTNTRDGWGGYFVYQEPIPPPTSRPTLPPTQSPSVSPPTSASSDDSGGSNCVREYEHDRTCGSHFFGEHYQDLDAALAACAANSGCSGVYDNRCDEQTIQYGSRATGFVMCDSDYAFEASFTGSCIVTCEAPATPAPTPDRCTLYVAGPVVASRGNQVETVDTFQNYELTFTMELADDWSIIAAGRYESRYYRSILHVGDSDGQRLPGIYFNPSGRLHLTQSHSYCDVCCCQYLVNEATGVTFEAGKTYEIKVQIESNQMTVYVDGTHAGTASGSATYAATDAAVYVGDPWYDAAAVTLSHICLKEIVYPSPSSRPTLAPSGVPTSAPTSRPTLPPSHVPLPAPTAVPSSMPSPQPSVSPHPTPVPSSLPTSAPTPHVTTALDHALCFSPACRLSDFVGSLNAELEMGATCTVGEGQCA